MVGLKRACERFLNAASIVDELISSPRRRAIFCGRSVAASPPRTHAAVGRPYGECWIPVPLPPPG